MMPNLGSGGTTPVASATVVWTLAVALLGAACGGEPPAASRGDAGPGPDGGMPIGDSGATDADAAPPAPDGELDVPRSDAGDTPRPDAHADDAEPDAPDGADAPDAGPDPVDPEPAGILLLEAGIVHVPVGPPDGEGAATTEPRLSLRVSLDDVPEDDAREGTLVACRYRTTPEAGEVWDGTTLPPGSEALEGCWPMEGRQHLPLPGGIEITGHIPLPPAGAPHVLHAGWRLADAARISPPFDAWTFPLEAPASLEATGQLGAVRLRWQPADGAVAWEVERPAEPLTSLAVPEFFDADAPAPDITPGTTAASFQTRTDGVQLELNNFLVQPGASVAYRVRALGAEGDTGPWTAPVEAARGEELLTDFDSLGLQVTRTTDDNPVGPWEPIDFDPSEGLDRTAPRSGDARWYRFEFAIGADDVRIAEPARGARRVDLPNLRMVAGTFDGDTLTLQASLDDPGSFEPTLAGFTLRVQDEPARGNFSFGVPDWTPDAPLTITIGGFATGEPWEVEAFLLNSDAEAFNSLPLVVLSPPLPPAQVTASRNRIDEVRVAWDSVVGASGYQVLRDGTVIATTGNLVWDDFDAPAPAPPPQAAVVEASPGTRADGVALTWEERPRAAGADAVYTVRALNSVGPGRASVPAVGRREPPDLLGWEVEIDGVWQGRLLAVRSFLDANAPAGTLQWRPEDPQASVDASPSVVFLTIPEPASLPGAARSYRVRMVYEDGPGSPSPEPVTGFRRGPTRTGNIVWQVNLTDSGWDSIHPPGAQTSLTAIPVSTTLDFRAQATWLRPDNTTATVFSQVVQGRTGSGIPRVRTTQVTGIGPISARIFGEVESLGAFTEPIPRGVCAGTNPQPAFGQPDTFCQEGAPGGLGSFEVNFDSLPPFSIIHARAYAGSGSQVGYGETRTIPLLPRTPDTVRIEGGPDRIEILVPPTEVRASTEGFRVYRLEGATFNPATDRLVGDMQPAPPQTIFGPSVPGSWWLADFEARVPELSPVRITGSGTTAERPGETSIRWNPYASPPGPAERYVVVAWNQLGESAPGSVITASTTPRTALGYVVQVDDSAWGGPVSSPFAVLPVPLTGGALSWTDLDAPLSLLQDATVTAGDDQVSAVRTSASLVQTPRPRTYRVQALTAQGLTPPATLEATPSEGTYLYQWQVREPADPPGTFPRNFQLTSGSRSRTTDDDGANPDGRPHTYRVLVTRLADNASVVSSTTAIGRRATRPPVVLTGFPSIDDVGVTSFRLRAQVQDGGSPRFTRVVACLVPAGTTGAVTRFTGGVSCRAIVAAPGVTSYTFSILWGDVPRGGSVTANASIFSPTWSGATYYASPNTVTFFRP